MKRAEKIVDALLEDEGTKEFLDRNSDLALGAQLVAAIDNLSIPRDQINGIEVYGILIDDDGTVLGRAEPGQPTMEYGLSVHQYGGGLHDVGDYKTPEEAKEAARQLRVLLPHVHIFYDEISPA
jgi:hypothetical protein